MSLTIKAKPLILVGCEGSGRSAIAFHLIRKFPHKFQRLISHTTRKPRPSELDHQHYHFVEEKFVTENVGRFVTLTKSAHGHYYGLLGEEVMRVMQGNRIPVFKMTLQAYINNISQQGTLQIPPKPTPAPPPPNGLTPILPNLPKYLTRNKQIQCNALYITVPDLHELQRRLKCSPVEEQEQQYKIQKAKKEQLEFGRYFGEEDVIVSREDMEVTIKLLQGRLFELY